MTECIFCKIAKKEIPSDLIYEDERVVVFKDIKPKASVHFLIVPKKHIVSIDHLEPQDKDLVGDLIFTAKKLAKEKNLDGYKIHINVGKNGGQLIEHLHLHLLSGKLENITNI